MSRTINLFVESPNQTLTGFTFPSTKEILSKVLHGIYESNIDWQCYLSIKDIISLLGEDKCRNILLFDEYFRDYDEIERLYVKTSTAVISVDHASSKIYPLSDLKSLLISKGFLEVLTT